MIEEQRGSFVIILDDGGTEVLGPREGTMVDNIETEGSGYGGHYGK